MKRNRILTFCSSMLVATLVTCLSSADHRPASRDCHSVHDTNGLKARGGRRHAHKPKKAPARPARLYVGPSASGEAVRILATGYLVQPLRRRTQGHTIIGPDDLDAPWIVDRVIDSYEAGHTVGLTSATADDIEHLRVLLDHKGSAKPPEHIDAAELATFRRAFRDDGQAHHSAHVLLPRAAGVSSGLLGPEDEARLRRLRKGPLRERARHKLVAHRQHERQATADRNDLEVLRGRIFAAEPELPSLPADSPEQDLTTLAESYTTHILATNSDGYQIQIVNSIWGVRSFMNSADLYYVIQEVDYRVTQVDQGLGFYGSWNNYAFNYPVEQHGSPTLIQASPQTTREATTITSGTSYTLGGSAGWNETQGLNALVSGSISISHSTSVTVPPITVENNADFETAEAAWSYELTQPEVSGNVSMYNHWIWSVPFSSYQASQTDFQFRSEASVETSIPLGPQLRLDTEHLSSVPMPFGQVFALQSPAVTSVTPSCVDTGETFAVEGSGFYPSLVEAVVIGGMQVEAANLTLSSDSRIDVIAPDTIECHGTGCTVAVQTAQGTSNTDETIAISVLCE